jgi:hypothetical protein
MNGATLNNSKMEEVTSQLSDFGGGGWVLFKYMSGTTLKSSKNAMLHSSNDVDTFSLGVNNLRKKAWGVSDGSQVL